MILHFKWMRPPSQDASGKWRFRLESPTRNVIILVVTVTGRRPHPTYYIITTGKEFNDTWIPFQALGRWFKGVPCHSSDIFPCHAPYTVAYSCWYCWYIIRVLSRDFPLKGSELWPPTQFFHLSNGKIPGCLDYIGDYNNQPCGGYNQPLWGSLLTNQYNGK